jgi:hypothetical protein
MLKQRSCLGVSGLQYRKQLPYLPHTELQTPQLMKKSAKTLGKFGYLYGQMHYETEKSAH